VVDVSRACACPPAFEVLVVFLKILRQCVSVNNCAWAGLSTEAEVYVVSVGSTALGALSLRFEGIVVPPTAATEDHLGG